MDKDHGFACQIGLFLSHKSWNIGSFCANLGNKANLRGIYKKNRKKIEENWHKLAETIGWTTR